MNIHEKLSQIQSELKAPKNQYNSFGKYNYRSLEDITEAIKPFLQDLCCYLTMSDKVLEVGGRVYIQATATINDAESSDSISVTALAREAENKKGMDDSQITGAASSYARKYACNGLFAIDDTKDADATQTGDKKQTNNKKEELTKQQAENKNIPSENAQKWIDYIDSFTNKSIDDFNAMWEENAKKINSVFSGFDLKKINQTYRNTKIYLEENM